ncbi:MAG TPA: hypothetical protein VF310_12775, partial [Vicinamibacteria bacterium]
DGRRGAATALRTVLERPDLRRELTPYWLLRGTPGDTAALQALALRLAGPVPPPLPARDWVRFIEAACRTQAAETPGS